MLDQVLNTFNIISDFDLSIMKQRQTLFDARLIITQKKYNIVLYGMVMIAYLLLIFIYQNQIKGNNEIYPYVFGIF